MNYILGLYHASLVAATLYMAYCLYDLILGKQDD